MTQTKPTVTASLTGKWKPYPAYKDSGVEWLGEIPAHWEVRRLKYVMKDMVAGPFGSSLTKDLYTERGYRVYGQEQVIPADFSIGDYYISKELYLTMRRYAVNTGDVLVSCVGTFGKVAVVPPEAEPGIINPRLAKLVPNKVAIIPAYLGLLLGSQVAFEQMEQVSRGGTMGVINLSLLSEVQLPLPPISTQHAILTYLDRETTKINVLIAKKERLIELLQEKRAALISHAVTKGLDPTVRMRDSGVEWLGEIPVHWEAKKIKRLCQVKRGASPRPIDDPIYFDDEGEYAWVRISDVSASSKYLLKTEQQLSELGQSKSVCLDPGELFVSIAGTVGKPIITQIKCCIHDGFVYFTGLKQNREYLFYVFSGGELYKGLGKLGTQLNLNTDTIGDIRIPVPPDTEQCAIAAYIDSETARIDTLISRIQEGIEKLKEYSSALISAAVTGKIDVREETSSPGDRDL
jgi:type I restriction enzyme, S subunit